MVKKIIKNLMILSFASINFGLIALEKSEEKIEFIGLPSDLLDFSTKIPIELDDVNKKALVSLDQPERNIQIEQDKTLPWIKLASAFIAIMIILGLKLLPKTRDEPITLIKNAKSQAISKLELLKSRKLNLETFYAELSDILRSYIEDRYQIKALKKTTEEFLATIQENTIQFPEIELFHFLTLSDRVKFAKVTPTRDECALGYEVVKKIIGD